MPELLRALFSTAFGWCGLVGSASGLARVYLPEPDPGALKRRMAAEYPGVRFKEHGFAGPALELQRYFNGEKLSCRCPLDFSGASYFQRAVWRAARTIPYGQMRTYGWIARRIGRPGAVRAVGSALGRNPFPLIVPCHRVIRQDGGLGGFSAVQGVAMKEKLLRLEGAKV